MALTNMQALDVVIGSVNGVSGQSPNPGQTLKQGGITEGGRLGAFKSLVVTDQQRGVKKHGHEIVSSTLSGIAIDDLVQATADVVRANATPIPAAVILSAEAVAAPAAIPRTRRPKAPSKRAATKKGQGKKKPARKAVSKRPTGRKRTQIKRASKSRRRHRR